MGKRLVKIARLVQKEPVAAPITRVAADVRAMKMHLLVINLWEMIKPHNPVQVKSL
jgi:hypothetical protein